MRREMRRHHTEPAPRVVVKQSLSRSVSGPVPLVPPDTEGVRELLAAEGTSATLMDVAKGIIARLLENPELEGPPMEPLFLFDCDVRWICRLSDICYAELACAHERLLRGPCVLEASGQALIWQRQLTDIRCTLLGGGRFPASFQMTEDIFLDMEKTSRFLEAAEDMYCKADAVLYHNNVHAADVTQCVHALLVQFGFASYFDQLSILALLLGAAVHDMGHDGRTNSYHVNVGDDIALTYNDISVLENMHISKTFKLMRSAQSSVLQFKLSSCTGAVMVVAFCAWCRTRLRTYWPLSLEDVEFAARGNFNADLARAQVRTVTDVYQLVKLRLDSLEGRVNDSNETSSWELCVVVVCIFSRWVTGNLAFSLDVSIENIRQADFKSLVEKLGNDMIEWHEEKAMSALRVMVLHAMDISNPAKILTLSDKWSDLLRQEFFLQGDQEKQLGLPVSPLCDRDTVRFASSQVGFFSIIVQPTFALLAELQYGVKDVLLAHLRKNTEEWEARKKAESLGRSVWAARV
ncbi:regA [Symbiodinium natans]|uniref:Phosphodiesterase n=1 Tax=Symbiodinium natans TaxID=878477 RepID=A0A812I7A5_9DINO|nr:regA [Symbiodinium natans]